MIYGSEKFREEFLKDTFEYAEKHQINLLVCVKEIELYANEVFVLTSFNERVVNRSHIPVLTIPVDNSIYDSGISK